MFNPLHNMHFGSRTVQKACLQSMHTERNSATSHSYINYRLKSEVSIMLCCRLCSTLYTVVQFEKHLCNQNSHYKNTDDFCYEGKPSCAIAKSTLFAVSKDEWDTKEDTGKSMKNALYVPRGTSWLKRRRTVKKSSP